MGTFASQRGSQLGKLTASAFREAPSPVDRLDLARIADISDGSANFGFSLKAISLCHLLQRLQVLLAGLLNELVQDSSPLAQPDKGFFADLIVL